MGKIYAVRVGRVTGKLYSWDDCLASTKGYSGAVYKGFKSEEDADKWLNDFNDGKTVRTDIEAYVDGSYNDSTGMFGWGVVILRDGIPIDTISDGTINQYSESRNIAGELYGAICAIKWCIKNKYDSIRIYHDLVHTAQWASDGYRCNTEVGKFYQKELESLNNGFELYFTNIKGHSGIQYNELADKLAKRGAELD